MSKPVRATRKKVDPASVDATLIALVVLVAVGTLLFFVATFWRSPWGPPEAWGQFGDYLGGVINPVVGIVTALLVARTLSATRKEARSTRRQLRQQIELARNEVAIADAQRLLEGVLNTYYEVMKHREYDGAMDTRTNGVAGRNSQKFSHIFSSANLRKEVSDFVAATGPFPALFSDNWRAGAAEIIGLLKEISQACSDYEKLVGRKQYTDYFRRRVWPATDLLHAVGAIDEVLHASLTPAEMNMPPAP